MARFIKDHVALLSLAALAILLVVVRACIQSVVIDEAHSYLWYARWRPWYRGLPNHVLNSILELLTTSVFGLNELSLRIPAILGAVLYVGSAVAFCLLLSSRKLLQLPLFLCLVYNPMIFDYLAAARGYSLGMGFLLAAIVVMASVVLSDDPLEQPRFRSKCVVASVLLGLSFSATFSVAFVNIALILLFFVWAAAQTCEVRGRIRLAVSCFLPGILVVLVICGYTLWGYPKVPLEMGSHSLVEMWNSMADASFDHPNPEVANPWMFVLLKRLQPLLPYIGALAMAVLYVAAEIRRPRRLLNMARILAGTALLALVLHWGIFHILGTPLPYGRFALSFVLLWTLVFGALLAIRFQSPGKDLVRVGGVAVLIAVAGYFLGCLRISYFMEWSHNADAKQVYWVVDDLHRRCGINDFGMDWLFSDALNFYRAAYGGSSLMNFTGSDSDKLPADRSAYVIVYSSNEEFIKQQRLQVVYHGERSDAAVAIRGCGVVTPSSRH